MSSPNMETGNEHFWGIILAGGEGKRLQGFIKSRFGHQHPKQFCVFTGTRSMLRHTLDRVRRVVPRQRLLTIINRHHLRYAEEQLSDQLPENIIRQPLSRETGPGILLPLLHIARRDPEALIGVFPSDHFILEEDRFTGYVNRAYEFVRSNPDFLVTLGIDAHYPETAYGWIEQGGKINWGNEASFYRVKSFWEKPQEHIACELHSKKCLWNTLVTVGRAKRLLWHFQTRTPEIYEPFRKIGLALSSYEEESTVEAVFATLPDVNFSSRLLERIPEDLCVMKVAGVYWSDWGEPQRIEHDVARFGSILHERRYRGTYEGDILRLRHS